MPSNESKHSDQFDQFDQGQGATHIAALDALHKLIELTASYPPGHPRIEKALSSSTSLLIDIATEGNTKIQVTPDAFIIDDAQIECPQHLQGLANKLHRLGIAALSFDVGITTIELNAFVQIINQPKANALYGNEIVNSLSTQAVEHISATALQFRDEGFTDTESDQVPTDPRTRWRDAIARVLHGIDQLDSINATDLAAMLKELSSGDGDVDSFLEQIAEAVKASEQNGASKSQIGCWLGVFVLALSPELRSRLMAMTAIGDDLMLSSMEQNLDASSIMELIDVLRNIDLKQTQFSSTAMRLLRKMSNQGHDQEGASDAIQELMEQWGIDSEELTQQVLERSIENLCTNEDAEKYSPDDYREQLDRLASQRVASDEQVDRYKYVNPNNDKDVLEQAAAVNALLFDYFEDIRLDELFKPLVKQLDLLIRRKRIDVIARACEVALEHVQDQADDPLWSNVMGFLHNLQDPLRIEQLISMLGSISSENHHWAKQILKASGQHALPPVLNALAAPLAEDLVDEFVQFLTGFEPGVIAEEITKAIRSTKSGRLMGLCLHELDDEISHSCAASLITDSSESVRMTVFEQLTPQWEKWPDRFVSVGLADSSMSINSITFDYLESRPLEEVLDVLTEFVNTTIAVDQTAVGRLSRACKLLARSEDGRTRLDEMLISFCWKISPNLVAKGVVIAGVLDAHSTDKSSRRAVSAWKRNPAIWIGRLFAKDRLAS